MPIVPPILTALTLAILLAPVAGATQHLVRPGDDVQLLDERLKPGDEIILMPGEHRPATLESVQGTRERPIIIRGLDPARPSTIEASTYGLRLCNPRHVRISDLSIVGATIHGLFLEGDADADAAGEEAAGEEAAAAFAGDVFVSRVTIAGTGPKGLRHALHARRLQTVRIEECRIVGWAGSAIELVACEDVEIRDCDFVGKEDFAQITGVRARAGSDRVRLDRCRFIDPGEQAVCLGGQSKLEDFRVPPGEETEPASIAEAARVQLTRCTFVNGRCPLAFVHAERCTVRNCTIIRPRQAVVSIRREQEDPRFRPTTNCNFGSNLIVWEKGDLAVLTHLAGGATTEGITLEDNLWWTPDFDAQKDELGPFPGTAAFPQVTDVDPKLDEQLKPTADEARLYGADAP
jgi:hypothetical protein